MHTISWPWLLLLLPVIVTATAVHAISDDCECSELIGQVLANICDAPATAAGMVAGAWALVKVGEVRLARKNSPDWRKAVDQLVAALEREKSE